MFSHKSRLQKNSNPDSRLKLKENNHSRKNQSKWELKNYREIHSFSFNPELTATGAAMLLLTRFASPGAALQVPQTIANTATTISACNSTQSGNHSILPDNSMQFNVFDNEHIPPEVLKPVKPAINKQKVIKTETVESGFILTKPNSEIPIKILPEYQAYLETLNSNERIAEEQKIKRLEKEVRDTLPKLGIPSEVMDKIKKTNFTFYLSHNLEEQEIQGYYNQKTNAIVLRDSHNLINILSNEMYHASVATRNFHFAKKNNMPLTPDKIYKPGRVLDFDSPFFWKDNLDRIQASAFLAANNEVKENLKWLQKLHAKVKSGKQLQSGEATFYFEVKEALKHYSPLEYTKEYTMAEYKILKDQYTKKIHPDNSLSITKKCCPKALLDFRFYPRNLDGKNGKVTGSLRYDDKKKMDVFLYDWTELLKRYESGGSYSGIPLHHQYSELSSDIQMMNPELRSLLAPAWCDYFSRFHQVEDYCKPRF